MIQTAQSGLLLVNKPSGPTSYDMIRWAKRISKPARLGHAGTLDPLASGLLILLFGSATKRQSEVMGQKKTYLCTIKLGQKTDSADTTGRVVEEKAVPALTRNNVQEVLNGFLGEIQQIPPMYAALKKDGVPLYKLARQGVTIDRPPRAITIHSISLLELKDDTIEFRAECSSGTYVRTLAEDIAQRLGTVGTMAALVREAIGSYQLADALPGEELKTMTSDELWRKVAS